MPKKGYQQSQAHRDAISQAMQRRNNMEGKFWTLQRILTVSVAIVLFGFILWMTYDIGTRLSNVEQENYEQEIQIQAQGKQIPFHAKFLKIVAELQEVAKGKMTPKEIIDVSEVIASECIAHNDIGLTSDKIFAMIERESDFNPMAISHKRAYGLMQLIRPTFEIYLNDVGYSIFSKEIALNPVINVKAGIKHLVYLRKYWLEEGVDSWTIAINSYFWGVGATWELFLAKNRSRLPSMEYGKAIIDASEKWRKKGLN